MLTVPKDSPQQLSLLQDDVSATLSTSITKLNTLNNFSADKIKKTKGNLAACIRLLSESKTNLHSILTKIRKSKIRGDAYYEISKFVNLVMYFLFMSFNFRSTTGISILLECIILHCAVWFNYDIHDGQNSKDGGECNIYRKNMFSNQDIARYSRQLILPHMGMNGQSNLLNASVLVVGAGGLGSSILLYLASAGIGTLGIADYDVVEFSNLQRQVIHDETKIGISKAESAAESISRLNSSINVKIYNSFIASDNIMTLINDFQIIVDATDNVATRYLLNDAAVLSGKPLVSGSALQWEGQLTIYNFNGSPCYRCLFPVPPPPECVTNCADGGVLGVVPGLMGCLQALEVIKIASGLTPSYAGTMLLVDAFSGAFRTVKLRSKQESCIVCGDNPTLTTILDDYPTFCGSSAIDKLPNIKIIHDQDRITVFEYADILKSDSPHVLVDVRDPLQFQICSLPNALSVPLRILESENCHPTLLKAIQDKMQIYIVCRLGNDSQRALVYLQNMYQDIQVKDIIGGLEEYALKIDSSFPRY